MKLVAKTKQKLEMQGGYRFERVSASVDARFLSKQAQRRSSGLWGDCSRVLVNNAGQTMDQYPAACGEVVYF